MLGRGWVDGVATIVARQDHEGTYHLHEGASLYHEAFDYIADVKPDDASDVFRATFTEIFQGDSERRPNVGDIARVKLHAKNKEVKFDRDALKSEKKIVANADRAAFAALRLGTACVWRCRRWRWTRSRRRGMPPSPRRRKRWTSTTLRRQPVIPPPPRMPWLKGSSGTTSR